MRLTLRTLLAYMDDTLAARDSGELAQKIAESDHARQLLDRIRRVTRYYHRRRVPGPDRIQIEESAAYLDDRLPNAQVADFERRCLGSDSYLAEVACLHQVLSLGASNRGALPAKTRERLLAMSDRRVPKTSSSVDIVPLEFPANPPSRWIERLRKSGPVAGGFFLGVLTTWLLMTFMPSTSPLASVNPNQVAGIDPSDNANTQAKGEAGSTPAAVEVANAILSTTPPGTAIPVADSVEGATKKDAIAPLAVAEAKAAPPPTVLAEPDTSALESAPIQVALAPAAPAKVIADPEPNPPSNQEPENPQGVALRPLASLSTEGTVLFQRSNDVVRKVPARGYLYAGDALRNLDPFRSLIEYSTGLTIEMVGTTRMTLLPTSESIGVRLEVGRLVTRTGDRPCTWRLQTGAAELTIEMPSAQSLAGIERQNIENSRADDALARRRSSTVIHVIRGDVVVRSPQETRRLSGGQHVAYTPGEGLGLPELTETLVEWIAPPALEAHESRGLEKLASTIPDRPSPEALRDLLADHSKSVRKLTIQALQGLDAAGELARGMRDRMADIRVAAALALRGLIQLDDANAELVREAVAKTFAEPEASQIVALLVGYSPESIREPTTRSHLTQLLSSTEIAVRELAILNLRDLTGRDLGYSAEGDGRSRASLAQWEKWAAESVKATPADPIAP